MRINADFSRTVIVMPSQHHWVPSPQAGVERVMLDRLGAEAGRSTSIVRYAPGAGFPHHQHPAGEEIFVLCGTFSEEEEHYPAGWYLRNPPGSSHGPASREGATIFVKLGQMPANETRRVRIDTRNPLSWQRRGQREHCPLWSGATERVSLQRLPPDECLFAGPVDGAELLVLSGEVAMGGQVCERGSWLRLPPQAQPDLVTGPQGATVYLKTGHMGAMGIPACA